MYTIKTTGVKSEVAEYEEVQKLFNALSQNVGNSNFDVNIFGEKKLGKTNYQVDIRSQVLTGDKSVTSANGTNLLSTCRTVIDNYKGRWRERKSNLKKQRAVQGMMIIEQ